MPEIFDTGWAEKILSVLRDKCLDVSALTYGTMCRTALIDNFMEKDVKYDGRKPTQFLTEISREADAIVIATYTFSPRKSHANCWHLIRRLNLDNVVEVEANSGVAVAWDSKIRDLAQTLSESLGLKLEEPPNFPWPTIWVEDKKKFRRILGVDVGDCVMVNKMTVGKAVSEDVIIVEEEGCIVDVSGVKLKGNSLNRLARLGRINLENVRVDSRRNLRFTYKTPRTVKAQVERKGVYLLNHNAYEVCNFAFKAEGMVVIGDDTTSIVTDILYRFQIPVLGIIDKDADKLLENTPIPKNSVIITVKDDDAAGENVFKEVFGGENRILKSFSYVKSEVIKKLSGLFLDVKEF